MNTSVIFSHNLSELVRQTDGSLKARRGTITKETMIDGQKRACELAKSTGRDIRHEAFNGALGRWEFLGIYHPDGTCTQWTGERQLFTGNPACPWEEIPAKGTKAKDMG